MNGIRFLLGSEKGDGTWYDLAAKWLENGFANNRLRRELARVQVALLL